eukprot:TRINITY_DN32521_c0_g1_i1.p1 TRINITY_DN32521_c0_g1~~TRINITY_DN32521_c0_g1_i1.p1  ORF type:complete len:686 (-),score=105.63 TRINITY_DN32521_c0_g1_i1:26-2044(-)
MTIRTPKGRPKVNARTSSYNTRASRVTKFAKPDAARKEDNGWQMQCSDLKSRIAALFNHDVMCDIVFEVDSIHIPAHKFVLSTASPVFYKQLYDEGDADRSETQGYFPPSIVSESVGGETYLSSHRPPTVISITDVPHNAFYEFLHFIYTDNVDVAFNNVLELILLADTYRVGGISDHCTEFLRKEISALHALKILKMCRTMQMKALLSSWFDAVKEAKSAKSAAIASASQSDTNRRKSAASSVASRRQTTISPMREADTESFVSASDMMDIASSAAGLKKSGNYDLDKIHFSGRMLDTELTTLVDELRLKSWMEIQKGTEVALSGEDFLDEDIFTIRSILSLECLTTTEIQLFRALNEWAERRCRQQGVAATGENKRQQLGKETLMRVRFPTMTPEQFQWEVIPSGILLYEETQQVLRTVNKSDGRTAQDLMLADDEDELTAGRFIRRPRTLRAPAGRLRPAHDTLTQESTLSTVSVGVNYAPKAGDHIDTMLGKELLAFYLKGSIDDKLANEGAPALQDGASTAQATGKLPPIASKQDSAGGRKKEKRPNQNMFLGAGMSTLTLSSHEAQLAKVSLGQERSPDDFIRLAGGIYSFQGERLLEMWVEAGVAMVKDHGPNSALANLELFAEEHGIELASEHEQDWRIRQALHMPAAPPIGRGVPLASFLVAH